MADTTFSDAIAKLKDAACDLTSLEVQTYVGDLEVAVDGITGTVDFEKILENGKTKGTLKLACVTRIEFDGDGFVLVPETAPPDHIQQAHSAAVKAGQDLRLGLISLFSEAIGLKTGH